MNITVYCSSREGIDPLFDNCAKAIGTWIAENRHTLIYGGMDKGDMRVLATAAKEAGGRVIGVVPTTRRGLAFPGNDENLLPEDLNQRKDIMINLGDRFVALPGGYGTLDEILSTLSQMMFNLTDPSKRLMIVNLRGVYDPLLQQFRQLTRGGLVDPGLVTRLVVADTCEAALRMLPDLCK